MHKILSSLYEALGKLFADSGQLPALEELREALQPKYSIRNRAGVSVTPQDYQDMDQTMRDVAMAADGVGAGRVADNPFIQTGGAGSPAYNAARTILDLKRRTAELLGRPREPSLAAPNAGAAETYNPDDIIDALGVIQSELGDAPLSDTRLKPRLMEVLHHKHGDHKGLTEDIFDTLQVMEGLVDSLTDDQLITEGVRDWVQRLEVTLNKLAARDPGFLSSDPANPHSAVQMLNQLARLGNSNDVSQGIDKEVGRQVDELLQRVVKDYDANPEVFSDVVDELHPLIDRQSRTYRGNVERTVRASEGQQKLARARRAVLKEISVRIAGKDVPELMLELLNPGWRNLMVHTHLRHGPDSNEWRDQLALVDQLMGQLNGSIEEDDAEFVNPDKLLRRVVEGLNSISFDPSKRTPLIMHMSSALIGDTTGKKAPVKSVSVENAAVEDALGLSGLLPEVDPQIESKDEGVRDSWKHAVERARRIQIGEWLAASDREGRPLILSVAFVGDEGASFVLVNRKGVKTLERDLKEMADDLHQGRITLLDDYDLPLMERASQRMLENMHNQLAFQASHDELTQLMNRKEFERVVEAGLKQAKGKGNQHALLYLDLDQFKIVNNTSGHRAGDELLRTIGETLSTQHGKEDQRIARLGGDEFGLLLEDVESIDARRIAEDVLETIRGVTFEWEGRNYNLTASMGLVFIDQSTDSVDSVMQYADEACFSAKDAGRNRVQEYELGDKLMMKRHGAMEWVTQLDAALEDDRLILNCQKIQPINGSTDSNDVHYEILLSMLDELGDVVAPTELINAAETYNRMTTIDRWVIRNVLQWMSDNRSVLDDFGGFAINVSGHSVNDSTFPDFVLEQFGKTQAPTAKVCFEITETAAIANLDNAVDFMNRMRIIGCRFSLDDFGTGLSSYSYLRNLPVDYVKIDGVFVKDIADNPADYAVVRSINEIGHYMGKRTVAEFVEDMQILDSLKEIGVDYAQGFQISKPGLLSDLRMSA
jgi:diguanylate cyclase (GGDEF)-like protein